MEAYLIYALLIYMVLSETWRSIENLLVHTGVKKLDVPIPKGFPLQFKLIRGVLSLLLGLILSAAYYFGTIGFWTVTLGMMVVYGAQAIAIELIAQRFGPTAFRSANRESEALPLTSPSLNSSAEVTTAESGSEIRSN